MAPPATPPLGSPLAAQLDADLATLLGKAPAPSENPVRAVIFGRARFEQHGRSLAATHEVVAGRQAGDFFPRLASNIALLQQARAVLERHVLEGQHLGPAAHWLLDNAALVDEQLHLIRQGLSPGFYRRLPRLRDEPLAGLPRVYGVAWAWVAHTDSGLDEGLLSAYLSAYQSVRPLTLAELWALPTTLRVVMLENLRRLAERTAMLELARDAAHRWIDQPDATRQLAPLDALAERLTARGVDSAFLLQLQQREDELPQAQARALSAWLSLRLPDPAAALAAQQSLATEDHQSIRNAITTLRQLDRLDWRRIVLATSPLMQTLAQSPVFSAEREDTQDATLHAVEKLARRSGHGETEVARALLALTERHTDRTAPAAAPRYWWHGPGRPELLRALGLGAAPADAAPTPPTAPMRLRTTVYLGGMAALAALATAWLMRHQASAEAPLWLLVLCTLLLLGPVGEAVVAVVNRLISESARPMRLPRLALADGLPADERVLVVMPCLLTSGHGIDGLSQQLLQHAVANPQRHVQFALLSDWADADQAEQPADAALLGQAAQAVQQLNARQPAPPGEPPRFLLLHRPRQWSETEQRWIGWERKRGKIEQLVQLLAAPADAGAPFVDLGAISRPHPGTRHLLSLDADTDLPPGRLLELMGVALHPLNRPRVDMRQRRVVSGYGILQPRVVTPLPPPEASTWYHALFSGECGIDPYSAASSEVYQDLFGEGSFSGKGLLNVMALHWTLGQRLPQGQVLSHDLLEGALARCAAVSDITVVEDAPGHADVAASRLHRWTRGDWQLLPFVLRPGRWPMAAISRWKIIDNLRRSLVAPMSLALLLLVLATSVLPLGWTLASVAAAFCAGPLLGALAGLAPSRDDIALPLFFRRAGAELLRVAGLAAWHLAQLVSLAWLHADAVLRALWRQAFSRRGLLQWTTAAAAQAAARSTLPALLRQHRRPVVLALALGAGALALAAAGRLAMPLATALLVALWAASPVWTWWASVPRPLPRRERLDLRERDWLRGVARDTWRFYAHHVGTDDHFLPPDNVQQQPREIVAHRTSPTNIGMYLLSAACAQALGFIGRADLAERLAATLDTLERLPRWQGHFYNWYDTRSLAVLPPAYVSTVDSGNCAGHLLAVAAACERLAATLPDPGRAAQLLAQSQRRLRALQPVLAGAPTLRDVAELVALRWNPADAADAADPQGTLHALVQRARLQLDALGQGQGQGRAGPHDESMLRQLHDHVALVASLLRDAVPDGRHVGADAQAWRALGRRCRALALAPDFAALYDPQRKLLHIGYRVEAQQLDDSHYDLLASEARLTSLLAIGKGDVPPAHWAALGRPFFAWGRGVGLKSWSGSMFEYLMPSLLLDEPPGSVLHQATRSAVQAQQLEAREHGTPWGISESAIAGQDHTLAYQYGPQGVPALALRRAPADERVLAPYASAMAVLVAPRAAVANLRALQALGARGAYGFIEALDYTPQRQVDGSPFVPVHTFMAHHQGMALVAIADQLLDGLPRRWAADDPVLRATRSLLHERAPREVPALRAPVPAPAPRRQRGTRLVAEVMPLAEPLPSTQLLTNGRHAVVLRSHGAGQSLWQGLALSRWRDDLPGDALGQFMMIRRDAAAGQPPQPWVSLSAHPAPDAAALYRCRHLADRSVFEAEWPDLLARTTVWVSPEDDCELREVTLIARGDTPVALTLASHAELVLAPQRADEAHPAFANLFVRASWDADNQALYLARQPRLPDEQPVLAAHFLAWGAAATLPVQPLADRRRVLGRHGRSGQWLGDGGVSWLDEPADAAEADAGQADAGQADAGEAAVGSAPALRLPGRPLDTGLDPVASLRVVLQVQPGQEQRITFCTAAARELEPLETLVDRYRQSGQAERSSGMSHTMAGIRLRELQFDADSWAALLRLNTLVTALVTRDPPPPSRSGSTLRCERRLLWRHGLSGERPIVLVTITAELGLALVQTLKKALWLWNAAGLGVDLVVLNAEPASYLSPVQHQLQMLRERLQQQQQHPAAGAGAARGEMHVLPLALLGPDERHTLQVLARVRLLADGRSLAQQLERELDEHRIARLDRLAGQALPVAAAWPLQAAAPRTPVPAPELQFQGPLSDAGFEVSLQRHPARPWVNVLANEGFGCLVSEMGAGFTWAGNSRMQQLTGWSNDALCDPPSEQLLLHDLDSGQVWPLGQGLGAADEGPRRVRHGLGFCAMQQRVAGIEVALSWCVDVQAAVKQWLAVLRLPAGAAPRRVRLVATAEWQLGAQRADRLSVATQRHRFASQAGGEGLPRPREVSALLATQLDPLGSGSDAGQAGGSTAFLALRCDAPGHAPQDADADDWTCDRREFSNGAGRAMLPRRLGRRQGLGLDPCAALGVVLALSPGSERAVCVLLGHAGTADAARALAASAWAVAPTERLAAQRAQWPARLGAVQVATPDPAFDALVNHWLPYQTLVSRLWARAGFYQAGGAFGFRDQLQDAMSLVSREPALLAAQIRLHATRQFAEGDVQHWWHQPGGAGVRTHFSDDLLWLPLACALYVERSGDHALLDEALPFLDGAPVPAGQEDLYETPRASLATASVYEHAARAIDHSLRIGAHGLPLMGTGDWNDGMNRVGHGGRGESVWLAWFLCRVVDAMLPLAEARGDQARAGTWRAARAGWVRALEAQAWDGRWYCRGFFDDGSPLGSAANAECRIDLIAQAWAVLSGAGQPERARQAMASAEALLLDERAGVLRLLDPPLQHARPSAGYIQAYPPGVRENGGQYNHAAVWALMAWAQLGQAGAAWAAFRLMSPAHRWQQPRQAEAYALEPYVMAGDIYTQPPYQGRGGWSWYTGSAGWLMRAAQESLLGVTARHDGLLLQPCLPPHWPLATVRLLHQGHRLTVHLCGNAATWQSAVAAFAQAATAAPGELLPWAALAGVSDVLVRPGTAAPGAAMTPQTAPETAPEPAP
ncbi:GH36-type glycosyl hydrolase domain-containing protein [Aquabacterium sp. OR-4]|uniref:GH36-type glycosyl hydrolase domain-containing protein n=1 Tax=Aquabacterium sp. OR-4 TaxID=2978127 RepID=UPI0028C88B3B|nr:glucoamylase family protein [Aquabacterium sp. OR-4]MDT7835072.1 glucoamylase family protein [Aquabacterium sp. OR-4]